MVRRSVLFTPGDRPEMMRTAPDSGADVVVFDLEDAVSPNRKNEAREGVRNVLTDPDFDPECEVCVRVNAESVREDLEELLENASDGLRLDGVALPKVTDATDVVTLAEALAEAGRDVAVFALIETARGVLAADEVAAVPATAALVFGAEDLAADVGASRTAEGTEVLYARQRVVIAAAAADCDAIDTVYTDFRDEAGLREETAAARRLGYDGKLAIHPDQIGPIHDAFRPTREELEWAGRVLEAEAAGDDRGVFEVDGEMIDAPLLERARRIVAYANSTDRSKGPTD